jgi:6-phosphogluconolactonase (cycloisomerase 2 family)
MFLRECSQLSIARLRVCTLLFALASVCCACGGGGSSSTTTPPSLVSISVNPASPTLALGVTQQFSALGTYSDGSTKAVATATWSSSNPNVATIAGTGLLSSLAQGNITINAAVGSIAGTAAVTIGPPILMSISVSPSSAIVDLGSNSHSQLRAIATYTNGSTDVSTSATWSVVNNYVASVDSSGTLTGHKSGHTSVIAAFNNLSGSAEVTVQAPPRHLYVTSDTGRLVTRATVDNSTGQLRYESYGPTNVLNGVFECLTTDPSNDYAYISFTVPNPGTGGSPGSVAMFSIDQSSGALTAVGSPMAVQIPLGCIQFEPSGKFGYSVSAVNNVNNPLVIFSRNATDGTLSVQNTVQLTAPGSGIVIDPLGQYLYLASVAASVGAQSFAYGFVIDSNTGGLTAVPGTPFVISNLSGQFSVDQVGRYLYMSNSNGSSVDVYSIDRATGKLTALSAMSLTTCINPSQLQFAPSNAFGYLTCSMDAQHTFKSASVESFAVSNAGQLSHIGSAPTGDAPHQFALDPSGRFGYVTGFSNYVYLYQIGNNIGNDGIAHAVGTLGAQPGSNSMLVVGGTAPVTYTTKFAYVSSTGDNKLSSYAIQSDGTWIPGASVLTQPNAFAFTGQPWTGDILLGSAGAPRSNVTPYALSPANGSPSPGFSFGDAATVGGVATDISDQWAFLSDSTNGVIYTYAHSNAGFWNLIPYAPSGQPTFTSFAAGAGAGPLAVDPAGRLLYVGNQGANTISAFQYFGTTPELNVVTGSPYPLAAKPVALTLAPNGLFLYVATDQQLSVYGVDYFNGGKLTLLGVKTLPVQLTSIAAEPSGRYVYAADSTGITGFSVNSTTGALTSIGSGPGITLANCNGIWAEPSGKYLYASTSTSNSGAVFAYQINPDGSLTALATNPVASSNQPAAMTFKALIQ